MCCIYGFQGFPGLVKMLERPPIGHFSKTIKQAVCLICRRCNTSRADIGFHDRVLQNWQHRKIQGVRTSSREGPPGRLGDLGCVPPASGRARLLGGAFGSQELACRNRPPPDAPALARIWHRQGCGVLMRIRSRVRSFDRNSDG